jgi:transcriptional regulator with XRE-family HTH domain
MSLRPDRDHRGDNRHPVIYALKGRRLALGRTQRDVAAAIHVQQSALGMWETGRITPTLGSVDQWARELGCELLIAEIDTEGTDAR